MDTELPVFTQEEMVIHEAQGFPKAYALLCKTLITISPFAQGPPRSFIPYALQSQEAIRVKELNQMFPIIDSEAPPSANLRSYDNILWEQLNHIGNAGFEPALFRVDQFGNVVYRNADSASPLAWDIDHWFPCSRGGKTVPSNLRILQWQVCKKKKNKLDFLIPWWDLQLGISVNQFLSIFASRNSDFRSRSFSFLFPDGGDEELNCLHNLHFHDFPKQFMDAKRKQGLAPAAIVSPQNSSGMMVLKTVDLNSSLRHSSDFPASMKSFQKVEDVANQELQRIRSNPLRENNQPIVDDHENNPYKAISYARDSLKQRKESRNNSDMMALKTVDLNRSLRHNSPFPASVKSFHKDEAVANQEFQRSRSSISKENNQPFVDDHENNPYLAISYARDSLRERKVAGKHQAEISQLDEELNKLKWKNDLERIALQELEAVLIRKRKRVEKCRRLSEAQASYRSLLEKMIRDAMHQTVVYKEQLRLNQVASSTLMARLEAQRAACDATEKKLQRKYKQRDKLEINAMACSERTPEGSQIYDYCHDNRTSLSLTRRVRPTKKELRVFLEEEQKAFEAGISLSFDDQEESEEEESHESTSIVNGGEDHCQPSKANKIESYNVEEGKQRELNVIKTDDESCKKNDGKKKQTYLCGLSYNVEGHDEILVSDNLKQVQKRGLDSIKSNESQKQWNLQLSSHEQQEESEEYRNRVGKGNVEKWLQILFENSKEGSSPPTPRNFNEPTNNTNTEMKQTEIELCTIRNEREKHRSDKMDSGKKFNEKSMAGTRSSAWKAGSRSRRSEIEDRVESKIDLPKCDSSRGFISFPSSPSVILGVRKSIDCMRKPRVIGDDENANENCILTNS